MNALSNYTLPDLLTLLARITAMARPRPEDRRGAQNANGEGA